MSNYKTQILDKIGFSTLVYGRINKKLHLNLANKALEKIIFDVINETNEQFFEKKGKNIYISNFEKNIRITINSYTNRVITVDNLSKLNP